MRIRGLEEGEGTEAGSFKVEITPATDEVAGSTKVTLNAADAAVGTTLRVSYRRRVIGARRVTVKTTSTTAKGALYAHWPLYSSGTDCTESSIKGWLHLHLPRVRATALPGFDNSYKSASTFSVTFSAIDPKRADGKMYDLDYEPLDEDGAIVTKGSGEVNWN